MFAAAGEAGRLGELAVREGLYRVLIPASRRIVDSGGQTRKGPPSGLI